MSKLHYTSVIFVDTRLKVDGTYCCDLLLLPGTYIRQISGEFIIFQQDSTLAYTQISFQTIFHEVV